MTADKHLLGKDENESFLSIEFEHSSKDKLKQHEAKHSALGGMYVCQDCGKTFVRHEHLRDHFIAKHSHQYPFRYLSSFRREKNVFHVFFSLLVVNIAGKVLSIKVNCMNITNKIIHTQVK